VALRFAQRLFEIAGPLVHEMGLTGGQVAEGAAIFAGIIARDNAKPGEQAIVGDLAAAIVRRLTRSGPTH
jgi:hypothetical protein